MPFSSAVFAALAIILPALAAPSVLNVEKFDGETNGKYIVQLKAGIATSSFLEATNTAATHQWDVINGFAGVLSPQEIDALRSNADVESIYEDGIMNAFITQENAPWGLARLSSHTALSGQDDIELDYHYMYDPSAGSGVDVYVVDTGVYTEHSQFGGRARWGGTFGPYPSADGNGHGTHCAGTVAGSQFGAAKEADIIAVKVLNDNGSGAVSDIISGLNFVQASVISSGRPSIVSMSLGGSASTPLDSAVAVLTSNGIHVVVAAGNSNTDAGNTSPARAPSAITVGASNITDGRAYFSNYGAVVDVFAPGVDITSAWIGNPYATNVISGTSMATPHVAGLVAYLITLEGNLSPADMSDKVQSLSLKNVLTDIPSGTVNELANNGALCFVLDICIF